MRYTESTQVFKAKQVAKLQTEALGSGAQDCADVSFTFKGQTICNPFMDSSGRFELTLEQAYETYGEENVNDFIEKCNSELYDRYRAAIRTIGYEGLLLLPVGVKTLLALTADLETKVRILEEVVKANYSKERNS